MNLYFPDDDVEMKVSIEDFDTDELLDADVIVCTVKKPDGTVATPTVIPVSTGKYKAIYVPTDIGVYNFGFTASGNMAKTMESRFRVRKKEAS